MVTESETAPPRVFKPRGIRSNLPAWLPAALLMLVTIALYWPATHHDFVNYDDNVYVFKNTHVAGGLTLAGISWILLNPISGNWHPLTMLSHMLDCQFFGLNPWGHHLTSVLLHAVNAALVFVLLRRMTGAMWRSFLVAALFAVHPLHVESVAWVAERKDVLSGCFGLLTLICYARYAGQPKAQGSKCKMFYLLALFFFVCGLMSKPMLVTWPFVMLLLDYWPLGRFHPGSLWQLVREKIPFLALTAGASVVTYVVQKQSGAVEAADNLPLGARGGNALISYCRYLGKMFWPTDMAYFYPHPGYWPVLQVLLAGLVLAGISAWFWMQRRSRPFLLMGWLWYLGTLVPVIGLVQVGLQAMADRYTYFPSIGIFIIVIWGAGELGRRWRPAVMWLSLAGTVAVVLCLALTRQQLGYWQDSESLFRHACAVTRNNYIAHTNLAIFLHSKGKTDAAVGQYREAILAKPDFAGSYNNLGHALFQEGRIDEAISQYQTALRFKPDYAEARCNLGIAVFQKGRTDEAIDQFETALQRKPDYADAHYNLALALDLKGRTDEAISQFQTALRLQPDDADVHYNFGLALDQAGRTNEAIDQYQAALRLQSDNPGARNNLGILLAGRDGNFGQAQELIQRAVELDPGNAAYLDSLAWVLLRQNHPAEALGYQLKAIAKSSPPDASLYDHLGNIYVAQKQNDLAAEAWRKSLSLEHNQEIQRKLDALPAH